MPHDIFLAVRYRAYLIYPCNTQTEGLTMMFVGFGIVCVPLTVIIYTMINQRRERILQGMLERGEKLSAAEIQRLGDRAPTFRYMI